MSVRHGKWTLLSITFSSSLYLIESLSLIPGNHQIKLREKEQNLRQSSGWTHLMRTRQSYFIAAIDCDHPPNDRQVYGGIPSLNLFNDARKRKKFLVRQKYSRAIIRHTLSCHCSIVYDSLLFHLDARWRRTEIWRVDSIYLGTCSLALVHALSLSLNFSIISTFSSGSRDSKKRRQIESPISKVFLYYSREKAHRRMELKVLSFLYPRNEMKRWPELARRQKSDYLKAKATFR